MEHNIDVTTQYVDLHLPKPKPSPNVAPRKEFLKPLAPIKSNYKGTDTLMSIYTPMAAPNTEEKKRVMTRTKHGKLQISSGMFYCKAK